MTSYDVSREIAVLPLAFYTIGFAIGPLFSAPMSELYGRRVVYWTTMVCLLVFTGISGAANSIALLTVMRLLAGFLGSGALAVGAGTLSIHILNIFIAFIVLYLHKLTNTLKEPFLTSGTIKHEAEQR